MLTQTSHRLLLAVVIASIIGGCTASRKTTTADSGTAAATLRKVQESYQALPDLALYGEMKISGVPATIWFEALSRRRDSIKIILTLPFGMPGGGLSATPDHFVFYDVREGAAIEGTPNRETFAKLIQIGLNYDEMIALLRGELPSFPTEDQYTAVERDGFIVYTTSNGAVSEEIVIEPTLAVVKSYTRRHTYPANAGEAPTVVTELSIAYDNFRKVGARHFANKAVVSVMDNQQTISVKINSAVDHLPAGESLALDLPAGIERRRM